MTVRYLLAESADGCLLGALPAYRTKAKGVFHFYDPHLLFVRPLLGDDSPSSDWLPALLGGSRSGARNALLIRAGLDAAERRSVLRALLDGFSFLGTELGARTRAFMYCDSPDAQELGMALDQTPLLATASAQLDLEWEDFDAYVSSLRRKRRATVRNEMSRFKAAGCSIEITSVEESAEVMALLRANLDRRYGHTVDTAALARRIRTQAAVLPGREVAFLCRRGTEVLGTALLFEWEGVLHARGLGLDYREPRATAVYFNLAYYAPIAYGIERKLRAIDFGIESLAAKVLRGARLRELWSVLVPPPAVRSRWQQAVEGWNRTQLEQWRQTEGAPDSGAQ